ncbi:MAG TPA: hypothetical protein VN579_02700, partial [Bryobacteraceae bacterium]|nr:hypothetical protein [Bryobacteraceae bacterium]
AGLRHHLGASNFEIDMVAGRVVRGSRPSSFRAPVIVFARSRGVQKTIACLGMGAGRRGGAISRAAEAPSTWSACARIRLLLIIRPKPFL